MVKRKRRPTHPGELLGVEVLPNAGVSQSELAALLRVSRRTINEICGERRPVSPDMAHRLARAFQTTPGLWLNLQAAIDLWDAEQEKADEYKKIRPVSAA